MSDGEKRFEERIVNINHISEVAKARVIKDVARKEDSFKRNFKGYVKVTYATASPPSIKSIEPIEGTFIDYIKRIRGGKYLPSILNTYSYPILILNLYFQSFSVLF